MKKLLLFALLLTGIINLNAQASITQVDELVDPLNYWLNSDYLNYGQRDLWNVFKPDSVHTYEGAIKFNYSASHQITTINYFISTGSDLYSKGNYTYYYDYDNKNQLIGNGTNFWKYIEEDNFSNDSVSNGRRLQIPVYFDMYGGKNEDKMMELIYDNSGSLKQYIVYENQNSANEWQIEHSYYYTYNSDGEISEINVYTSKGILYERYASLDWKDYSKRKLLSFFYTKFKSSNNEEYKLEFTWDGESYTILESDYYNDAWHNYSHYSKTVTDTCIITNRDDFEIIYDYFDSKGNPAGYLRYYKSSDSNPLLFTGGCRWITSYNDKDQAISTIYNTINEDSAISATVTDYYFYGLGGGNTGNGIETNKNNQFEVYPTYASSSITVNSPTINTLVKVFNNAGKMVVQAKIDAGKNTIDLSNLTGGMYYVQVINNQTYETHKVIKQ